jgi:hypothetical protein
MLYFEWRKKNAEDYYRSNNDVPTYGHQEQKKKKKQNFVFFLLLSLGDASIGKKKKKKRRTRNYDSYMIRVGSVSDGCCCCCCCDVAGREATAMSKDVDGVLNGDFVLQRSGGVASEV